MRFRSLSLQHSIKLRYVTFFYLYVMQGIPAGFALTAIANYLVAAGIEPYRVGQFVAAVGLPWALQFIWGPLIDRFQGSSMGRRKPWVLFAQLMSVAASLGILLISNPAAQLATLSVAFFIHSVCASVQDAGVDAMAISTIPTSERGRINAFMRGGMLFGTGVGAAALSLIIHRWGFFYAALTQTLLLLSMTAITFFIKEKRDDVLLPWSSRLVERLTHAPQHNMSMRRIYVELCRGLFSSQSLRLFGAIVLVYLCASVFIRVLSVHMIQQLQWNDSSLSVFTGTFGMLVALLSVFIAGVLSDKIGTRKLLLLMMTIIGTYLVCFNLLSPFWPNFAIARSGLIIWYTFDPMYSVAAMPALMALCRGGVEGSQFTTYMALVNLSDIAGAYLSGYALLWFPAPMIGLGCGLVVFGAMLAAGRALVDSNQTTPSETLHQREFGH